MSETFERDDTPERPGFLDPTAEYATCYFCGQPWDPVAVEGIDLSTEEEYYPRMVAVCPADVGGCR